jgi:hypothetical protein
MKISEDSREFGPHPRNRGDANTRKGIAQLQIFIDIGADVGLSVVLTFPGRSRVIIGDTGLTMISETVRHCSNAFNV